MMRTIHFQRGFTLLEMLLSIALIGIIAGVGIPVYQSFLNRNNIDIAASTIAQTLRRAQMLAESVDGDSVWGVQVAASTVTLFKGTTYATRDTAYDETYDIASGIAVSATQEYVFAKMTGETASTTALTLTSPNGETRNISVNAKGTVFY